jgi:hypothetical protein
MSAARTAGGTRHEAQSVDGGTVFGSGCIRRRAHDRGCLQHWRITIPGDRRGEAEAGYVFQRMHVEIRWTGCGAEVDADDLGVRPDFIIRVRVGGHLPKAGDSSLEAMGRAFMNVDGTGNMADVYYGAIRELTLLYPVAGSEAGNRLHDGARHLCADTWRADDVWRAQSPQGLRRRGSMARTFGARAGQRRTGQAGEVDNFRMRRVPLMRTQRYNEV